MDSNPVDFGGNSRQNTNNGNYGGDDNPGEVIRLKDVEPLNDPKCEHDMVLEGDKIGSARSWICNKCHRGVYLPKTVTKII